MRELLRFRLPLPSLLVLLSCSAAIACGAVPGGEDQAQGEASTTQQVPQPLIGSEKQQDHADHDCRIVLRSLQRSSTGPGYETTVIDGRSWYAWRGKLDVDPSILSEVQSVGVMFHLAPYGPWWETQAVDSGKQERGRRVFEITLAEHTVSPGMSMTSLNRTRIELIPVLVMEDGSRWFDHNRHAGEFDNYVLSDENGWSVSDDGTCSVAEEQGPRARAHIAFESGWAERQRGPVVRGGLVDISYDLQRMPECRGTHNGYPAWDLRGFVRFEPGGQQFESSLRTFLSKQGRPTNQAIPVGWTIHVPEDAQSMQLWFMNASGAGNNCVRWDSKFGENYRFRVGQRAEDLVQWMGNWGYGADRSCEVRPGVEDPLRLDDWRMSRACLFVEAEVYAPGVTDGEHPQWMQARAVWKTDAGEQGEDWLQERGRTGNNLRYRWEIPRERLLHSSWNRLEYSLQFSTDGVHWHTLARPDGSPRAIEKAY